MGNEQVGVHAVAAANGFLSFALIWLAAVWGQILANGWATARLRRPLVYALHQMLASLGLCLGAVHAFAQLAMPGTKLRLLHEFVPFSAPVSRFGIALGVLSLELMIATAVSILIQRRLGYHRWRGLHAANHFAFTLLTAHVLVAGSDVGDVRVWAPIAGMWLVSVLLWARSSRSLAALLRRLGVRSRAAAGRREGSGSRWALPAALTAPAGTPAITVNVDTTRCSRSGFCTLEAPEVFALTPNRLVYPPRVAARHGDAVTRAVAVCPERALALSRAPAGIHRRSRRPVAQV
ncbi:MAG TPA: hypothetical protein VES42_15885 [Pilimelia sp.]|nr:hypothetical protein [Pilimelia sp.]